MAKHIDKGKAFLVWMNLYATSLLCYTWTVLLFFSTDEAALLSRTPSLKLLLNVVAPRVSSNWKAIGLNLDIKDFRLSAIEKREHYQADDCCTEMFSNWLNLAPHTGSLPLTWGSVLSAIEKVDRVASEELLAELMGSMKSPAIHDQGPARKVCWIEHCA